MDQRGAKREKTEDIGGSGSRECASSEKRHFLVITCLFCSRRFSQQAEGNQLLGLVTFDHAEYTD